MVKERKNACARRFAALDRFAEPFEWSLPDGEAQFRSVPGAITSILILLLVAIYAGFKAKTLIERSDYII